MNSRSGYSTARKIGFTRREILKYAVLGTGAAVVAACSGNSRSGRTVADTITGESLTEFAKGTWYYAYHPAADDTGISRYRVSKIVVRGDGTFSYEVVEGASDFGSSTGTWGLQSGELTISGDASPGSYKAAGIPEPLSELSTITWFDQGTSTTPGGRPYFTDFPVPLRWDSATSSLIATAGRSQALLVIRRDQPPAIDYLPPFEAS